ncbi:MAG: LptF/LptG family permease [Elusimicrobia bacterium]|nr:LptF/LptG family permease [Elusimicrobiota bacterium]
MNKKNILKKYILKEFLESFLFGLAFFCLIFLLSEFFFRLPDFISFKASFAFILKYMGALLPMWLKDSMPVAVLVGIVFSLNRLSHDNEITAIKSCGINLPSLFAPVFLAGLVLVLFGIVLNNELVPRGFAKTIQMREIGLYNKQAEGPALQHKGIVYHSLDGRNFSIDAFDSKTGIIYNVIIDKFNSKYSLIEQTFARQMIYNNGKWVLKYVTERKFTDGGRELLSEKKLAEKVLTIPEKPEDFIPAKTDIDLLTTYELKDEIMRLKNASQPAIKQTVAYQLRFSYPFSSLVVMFLGLPLALGLGGKYAKVRGVGYVLVISFFYWTLMSLGRVLGEARILPPVLGAWLCNIVFLLTGITLFTKISK